MPYSEYRDSAVEWLGEIPAGWQLTKLKHIAKVRASSVDKKRRVDEVDIRFLGTDTVYNVDEIRNGLSLETASVNATELHRYSLREGDVLLTKDSVVPTRIADVSIVAEPLDNVVCGYHLTKVRSNPSKMSPRFLFWFLGCSAVNSFFLSEARGTTIIGLGSSVIGGTQVLEPPIAEQRVISDFLDRETTKIDALVAKKERLVELLQEKRTALITHAVTRGLDPDVPMKDSGVEWLAEVPAHWEVRPLKSMSDLQTGLTLGKRYEGEAVTTRPYLRVANVQDGYLALDDISEVEVSVRDAARFELRMGDVLVTEGGDFDKLGRGHVWEEQIAQCLHQNHIFAVRPRRTALTPHFLALVTSSGYGRAYFTATSKQSTNLASTNATKLRNLPVALPGLAEQVEIVLWASHESVRIDGLVAKIEKATDHLKELRTALISAAVTGKIDVREARPQ